MMGLLKGYKAKKKAKKKKAKKAKADMALWDVPALAGIKATPGRTDDMSSISLMLSNDSGGTKLLRLTGAILEPSIAEYQRLFVAGVEGDSVIEVASGESKVTLRTCCMDQTRKQPSRKIQYDVSKERAPKWMTEAGLRWTRESHHGLFPHQAKRKSIADLQQTCWEGHG